jgi:hypothetical protein
MLYHPLGVDPWNNTSGPALDNPYASFGWYRGKFTDTAGWIEQHWYTGYDKAGWSDGPTDLPDIDYNA